MGTAVGAIHSSDDILWGDVFETGVSMGRYIVEVIAD